MPAERQQLLRLHVAAPGREEEAGPGGGAGKDPDHGRAQVPAAVQADQAVASVFFFERLPHLLFELPRRVLRLQPMCDVGGRRPRQAGAPLAGEGGEVEVEADGRGGQGGLERERE